MSVENAYDFFRRARQDPDLEQEIEKRIAGLENEEVDVVLAELGIARGFDFTAEDAAMARDRVTREMKGAVAEEQGAPNRARVPPELLEPRAPAE